MFSSYFLGHLKIDWRLVIIITFAFEQIDKYVLEKKVFIIFLTFSIRARTYVWHSMHYIFRPIRFAISNTFYHWRNTLQTSSKQSCYLIFFLVKEYSVNFDEVIEIKSLHVVYQCPTDSICLELHPSIHWMQSNW